MDFVDKISPDKEGVKLLFTGQAGYILVSPNGAVMGIDLYLSDCVMRYDGFKRLCPKVVSASELKLDWLIATHAHYDHFDPDSVPVLLDNGKTVLLASQRCKEECEQLGVISDRTRFFSAGQTVQCDDITVHFIDCDHGKAAPDAVGVIIECGGKRLCVTGDTCLRLDRVEQYMQYGKIDVLFTPINGAFGNMDHVDAVALANALCPDLVIPYHYWMFAQHHGDPGAFEDEMKRVCPQIPYRFICPGEDILI